MRRLKTFLLMDWRDKRAFAHAWCAVASARLALRCLGMGRSLRLLVRDNPAAGSKERWPRAALWLPLAARYCPGGAGCLPRSIALLALLRRAGIACELRIGVAKVAPLLEAHAWVEVNGIPVNDTGDVGDRYRAFGPSIATS